MKFNTIKFNKLLSWNAKVQHKRGAFYIFISKMIVRALNLKKQDILTTYFGLDEKQKPYLLVDLQTSTKQPCHRLND
jgi:hypothetical protein